MEEEASKVVLLLSGLLAQKPTQFEITILPDCELSDGLPSLESSLVLVEGTYLGLDARILPRITKEIRHEYNLRKQRFGCTAELLTTLSCLLLVNPDHATAWADRRRSLLQCLHISNDHGIWDHELEYINLLMTQHSKAPFSWAHRKYVLRRVLDETMTSVLDIFRSETTICKAIAGRYPKNYYAWTHRRYCLDIVIESIDLNGEEKTTLLQDEWNEIVTEWLPKNVSDHSAAHYAAQVLELWMHQLESQPITAQELQHFVAEILNGIKALLEGEEPHETLWILRRMVVTILSSNHNNNPLLDDLIGEEVNSVAKNYLTTTSVSDVTNVHALTFLLWVSMLKRNQPTLWKTPLELPRVLARHTNVHHCMWAKGYQETE